MVNHNSKSDLPLASDKKAKIQHLVLSSEHIAYGCVRLRDFPFQTFRYRDARNVILQCERTLSLPI